MMEGRMQSKAGMGGDDSAVLTVDTALKRHMTSSACQAHYEGLKI